MPGTYYRPFLIPEIRVLLLENIDPLAIKIFENQGYFVEVVPKALTKEELIKKIDKIHILGIRSKTQVTKEVLALAPQLFAIGCFCIGTDQVDVLTASSRGIPVFNSPFSNGRSVAELVLAEIIALARQLGDRNNELHTNRWNKTSRGCYEVRGKALGIIGYGHIGSQLSVLAEAVGMMIIYYDVQPIMPHGLARSMDSLQDLLAAADFVSLHVPDSPETRLMMGKTQLSIMKKGSYLINASRGKVVDLQALKEQLDSGHLAGAALDVYPVEPECNGVIESDMVVKELHTCKNVILSPHIGGSTEEAQRAIGSEVASALVKYIHTGATIGSVLFPEVELRTPLRASQCRLLNVHKNVPGVLKKINKILCGYNIAKQTSDSKCNVAYLITDIDDIDKEEEAAFILQKIENDVVDSLCTRLLFQEGSLKHEKVPHSALWMPSDGMRGDCR